MKKIFLPLFLITFGLTLTARDYTQYTDTRMGSDSRFEFSRGNTYPGTGRPFGMHLWSPQTGQNNSGWKYVWKETEMRGFTLSHQCSPWTGDYASISLFPETGDTAILPAASRGATFSHKSETAHPDYYSVSFRNGISTELSPTDRCCCLRFRFPSEGKKAFLVLDYCGNLGDSYACGNKKIKGKISAVGRSKVFLENFFVIEFSRPFTDFKTAEAEGFSGSCVSFPAGSVVEVKVGTSYISPEQAELNLSREIGDRGFDAVREESRTVWNELLGRMDVTGDNEEDMRTFYTCLYRANLHSRKFYELDSEGKPFYYSPFDFKHHNGYMFTDNGFWDSYRAQFPLFNILHPTQQGRYMEAILDIYDQHGWLPAWNQPWEGGGMSGNHAISLLADAWVKGIRTVDPKRVLDAYIHEVSSKVHRGLGCGRFPEYWNRGYLPFPDYPIATTLTLEYAYDDWCGLTFAREVGDTAWIRKLEASTHNWKNVFCPSVGFMRGRDASGEWTPDFRPGAWGGPFEEGNSWHYSFSVPHDIPAMIEIYGGKKAFCAKLDSMFNIPSIIDTGFTDIWNEMVEMVVANLGMYNQGNQPCHHIPYLYVYGGQPEKTQRVVRDIMTRLYKCAPDGYPGDDDQGSMSSWYVLSALGIYNVCPGSTQYVIGSPLFERASVTLENGKVFTVIAEGNNEDNVCIASATLNGRPLPELFIDHSYIMNGGTLVLKMKEYQTEIY